MIVRNSLAPRGIDLGPAAPWTDTEDERMGGTFAVPVDDPDATPEIERRREQWRAAQQRRRDRLAESA